MTKIYYTVEEANQTLHSLEQAFSRLHAMHIHICSVSKSLKRKGFLPFDRDFTVHPKGADRSVIRDLASLKVLSDEMEDTLFRLAELGCHIDDIEFGSASWYARRHGRDVYLCWRLGEHSVGHWRELYVDFFGRMPIVDQEFSSEAEKLQARH